MNYQVRNFIDFAELKRDSSFSQNDLTGAMMQQAALLAHYGQLLARASRQVDDVKLILQSTEAMTDDAIRKDADRLGKKLTEAQISQAVRRSVAIVQVERALSEAKEVEQAAKIAVEAMRHRRDMLIQMGFISREEMKGDLFIRERKGREEALDLQKRAYLASVNRAEGE